MFLKDLWKNGRKTLVKTYDMNLKRTREKERAERLARLAEAEILFARRFVNESVLRERADSFSAVNWSHCNPIVSIEDGEVIQLDDNNIFTVALTYHRVLDSRGGRREMAIYYPDSITDMQLAHEMFHILSANVDGTKFSGLLALKNGFEVFCRSVDTGEVDLRYSTGRNALDEGITELLASRFMGDDMLTYFKSKVSLAAKAYAQYHDVAMILDGGNHHEFTKAYFSEDPTRPMAVIDDFTRRQRVADGSVLLWLEVPSSEMFSPEFLQEGFIDERILCACAQYALSFCRTKDDYMGEWQRIMLPIVRIIRHNMYFCSAWKDDYAERAMTDIASIY